jgi:SHS2 domain-containing protein
MRNSYTILDHPADLGIEARGGSLAEAFQQAAEGLIAVVTDPALIDPREEQRIDLHAADHEQLLVRWLSEILYLYDGKHFLAGQFSIRTLTPTSLSAVIYGEPLNPTRHSARLDIKAVTYHQLTIHEEKGTITLRIYLDI